MSEKTPTNHAILKAFQKYEEALNVALSLLRTAPEKAAIFTDDDDEAFRHNAAAAQVRDMYRAQRAFHSIARAAQARIDAKKGGAK